MPGLLTYFWKQRLAMVMRTVMTGLYIVLAGISLWLISDHPPAYLFDRIVPYGLPPLLSLLAAGFLSLFVLTLERIRTETLLFSLICLSFGGLNLDIFLLTIIDDPNTALTISRIDHFFLAAIQMGANLHLTFLVCENKRRWWLVYLAYATGLAMALSTPTDYYLAGMYEYEWGFFAKQGLLYSAMSLLWLTALCYCIFELTIGYRNAEAPAKKDRIRYLLYGFVLTAVLSLTNTPAIYGYEIYPLGSFVFLSLILLAYGLFKYNMQLAIQQLRNVLFHLGHWAVTGGTALAAALLPPLSSTGLKCLAGIGAAMVLYRPVHFLWNGLLNRIFSRSPNYLRKSYYELTYQLSGIHRLKSLYEITADWLFSVFMNCRCAMVFFTEEDRYFRGWGKWNPDYAGGFFTPSASLPTGDQPIDIADTHPIVKRLQRERRATVTRSTLDRWLFENLPADSDSDWIQHAGLLIPVYYRDQLSGLLIIGDKINDRSYARAEKSILSNLGIVLGPFIENANILENLEKKVEKRTRDLHEALAETEQKNEQIAGKNELITRRNHVILSLFDTATKIHAIAPFEKLFSFILQQLRSLFPHLGFGLLIEGGRSDILESGVFDGLTEAEQHRILKHRAHIADDNINGLMAGPIKGSRRADPDGPDDAVCWSLLPMTMGERRLGKMIIRGPALDADTRRIISIFLSQVSAVAQNKLLMHRLEIIANTDGLTGAANRSYFEKQHARAVENAKRFDNIHFSMLIIDINGLKTVNDNYGHASGDEMINTVASALKSICRETDTLSRIGGDEFALLLPATDSAQARRLLDRIRDEENRLAICCPAPDGTDMQIPIRVSIGLAGSDETRPENVLKLADQRMYTNKEHFYRQAAQ